MQHTLDLQAWYLLPVGRNPDCVASHAKSAELTSAAAAMVHTNTPVEPSAKNTGNRCLEVFFQHHAVEEVGYVYQTPSPPPPPRASAKNRRFPLPPYQTALLIGTRAAPASNVSQKLQIYLPVKAKATDIVFGRFYKIGPSVINSDTPLDASRKADGRTWSRSYGGHSCSLTKLLRASGDTKIDAVLTRLTIPPGGNEKVGQQMSVARIITIVSRVGSWERPTDLDILR
ncbi:unnamed protein product [Mesocestoides corti]|uniref:Uncharacterized protein n=1 Tax=Mesocestoides corti TaxID=53468 RepID=A0A0R3U2B1_MESCO|nr:unnamed protein product [Mesocestoides corti]